MVGGEHVHWSLVYWALLTTVGYLSFFFSLP
jgi:hypothetical protein